jgi:drug/metabolite transporter (DMT)-like permease
MAPDEPALRKADEAAERESDRRRDVDELLVWLVHMSSSSAEWTSHAPISPSGRHPTFSVLVLLGPIGTGVAYVLFHALIRDLGAARAATVSFLPPVVAVAIAVGALGEAWRPALIGGLVAVLAGLVFATRRRAGIGAQTRTVIPGDRWTR